MHSLFRGATLFAVVAMAAAQKNSSNTFASRVESACSELSQKHPESVLLPTSASFLNETLNYWDVRSAVAPACMFFPGSADEVAEALSILTTCEAQFAIRGGGHMNVSVCLPSWTESDTNREE